VQTGYDPLLQGFKFVPFNDLNSLDEALDERVCAVIMEPIQGEGGVVCPSPYYLKSAKELCESRNVLLIFDEVQVGLGRTGKLFAYEHFGVKPDIMTLAKALGNGLPIGAMLASEKLSASFGPGSHASTFGGTPLVSAVAYAVLGALLDEGWVEHCLEIGDYFKGELQELVSRFDFVREVRGLGLILGLVLDRPGAPYVQACLDEGFIINCVQDNVLRFAPPLIVKKKEIDSLLETLVSIFERV
jgi:acetylornithine aminotransferase